MRRSPGHHGPDDSLTVKGPIAHEKDRSGHAPYPDGMDPLESRSLRYFVAVAEELNFARAAGRLHIAAPALSRAIAALEDQLGVRLLDRTTRRVELTSAGRALLTRGQLALDALDAAARCARRAAEPQRRLVLALKAEFDGGLLEPILARHRQQPSAVDVEVTLCGHGEQLRLLRDGRADAALIRAPFETTGLATRELIAEPQRVALAATSPLASRVSLSLADLDAVYRRSSVAHLWVDRATGSDEWPGFSNASQLLLLVELGRLVPLVPASLTIRHPRPGVVYRDVVDAPPAVLSIVWPAQGASPDVAALVQAATEVATEHRSMGERVG